VDLLGEGEAAESGAGGRATSGTDGATDDVRENTTANGSGPKEKSVNKKNDVRNPGNEEDFDADGRDSEEDAATSYPVADADVTLDLSRPANSGLGLSRSTLPVLRTPTLSELEFAGNSGAPLLDSENSSCPVNLASTRIRARVAMVLLAQMVQDEEDTDEEEL